MCIVGYAIPLPVMKLLYDDALDRWERVKALDLRLRQTRRPITRRWLERERRDAVQEFRRAYVEQQVRLRAS